MNTNEYRQKFNLGKEIYHKNNDIDIFNFNNSVYKELCMPLEINGKDLVLESRYAKKIVHIFIQIMNWVELIVSVIIKKY